MAKILVVEDDTILGSSVHSALNQAGHDVRWATNHRKAFEYLEQDKPDIILLDIMLPEMDGYQILKKLKAGNSAFKEIPVVMLTNLGQIEEMNRAMELGAKDYVIKANVDLDQLVRMVSEKMDVIHAHA